MNATELLLSRQSTPRLQAPAPTGDDLENILKAGLRAPDHAGLTPWRFAVFTEKGLERLGGVFANAAKKIDPSDTAAHEKAAKMPHRAPMVIVAIACVKDHPKVPESEQLISAGCAVLGMQQMAQALGFGGMWRTGAYTYNTDVMKNLGLIEGEQIVGFLYLGSACFDAPVKQTKKIDEFVQFISN